MAVCNNGPGVDSQIADRVPASQSDYPSMRMVTHERTLTDREMGASSLAQLVRMVMDLDATSASGA
jgi:hypothetical protein